MGTLANNEHPEHSGSALFALTKSIFRESDIIFSGNYNLQSLNIYNGPS